MCKSLLFVTLALFTSCLFGQQKFSKNRIRWNKPQQPFHVVGNIYYVGTAGLGSYLIKTPQGDILIDGALPESVPQIESHIRNLGVKLTDVKYLLNSHAHYDHAGGLRALKKATGARMIASAGDAHTLNTGVQSSYGAGWDSTFPPVHVDRIIQDGETIALGGTVLTAHVTPGHTKGCTTWSMPVSEAGRTYNVVFYCSTSVPGYKLLHNGYYPEIANDYEHSFSVLEHMPCDVFLANHGEFFRLQQKLARVKPGAPNPFIDPDEMHRFVQASQAEFEAELARERHK